jgi:hypothetical protein
MKKNLAVFLALVLLGMGVLVYKNVSTTYSQAENLPPASDLEKIDGARECGTLGSYSNGVAYCLYTIHISTGDGKQQCTGFYFPRQGKAYCPRKQNPGGYSGWFNLASGN